MKQIKKIDVHAHVTLFPEYCPQFEFGERFCSAEELMEIYDRVDIERGVLLPIVAPEGQVVTMTNEACKFVTEKYPDRFVWFCNVDPRSMNNTVDADLSYLLQHYKTLGAKGVGELTANLDADDPKIDNLLHHCQACDMPVLIHIGPQKDGCYGIIDGLGISRIERILQKYPDLKLIGHSQPFWSEISADNTEEIRNCYPEGKVTEGRLAELLRQYKNLYCDLSAGSGANAMMRDPEYAAKFLTEFADQVMYGCDICYVGNTHQYRLSAFLERLVEDGKLSEENYYKIVRGNAIRVLKLDME